MTKVWTKTIAFTKTHTFLLICLLVGIVLALFAYGCESRVQSILNPTSPPVSGSLSKIKMVTRSELSSELAYIASLAESKYKDLDRQDEIRAMLLNQASIIATSGTFNFAGILPILAGIMGIGAVVDNRKAATTISTQQSQIAQLKATIANNA